VAAWRSGEGRYRGGEEGKEERAVHFAMGWKRRERCKDTAD
jgi:hypothetical protein